MPKNNEKINSKTLKGPINSSVELGKNRFSIFTPETKPNLTCARCAAPPECRGQSPKDKPCDKFEPRK